MAPLEFESETGSNSSIVFGIHGWPANPPYSVSNSESVFVEISSLPIFQVDVGEGRGATLLTHLQTNGSEQYGAPEPFFQCWAHAHVAFDGKSGC